jgi:hypothetical protein
MCKISSTFYEENAKFIFTFSLSQESNFLHFASELKIQKFSSEFVRERERRATKEDFSSPTHQRILHRAPQKEGCK